LIIVLLPAPFSPARAWISPGRAANDAPRSAWTPPATRAALLPARQIWCRSALPWAMDLAGVARTERQ